MTIVGVIPSVCPLVEVNLRHTAFSRRQAMAWHPSMVPSQLACTWPVCELVFASLTWRSRPHEEPWEASCSPMCCRLMSVMSWSMSRVPFGVGGGPLRLLLWWLRCGASRLFRSPVIVSLVVGQEVTHAARGRPGMRAPLVPVCVVPLSLAQSGLDVLRLRAADRYALTRD